MIRLEKIIEKNNLTIKYLESGDNTINICKKCLFMYGKDCLCYDCNDPEEMIEVKTEVFKDHLKTRLIKNNK